jgi:hypothetical protein
MRGLFEFESDKKKRGFLFNFNAFGIVEERLNMQIDEILEKLSPKNKSPKVKLLMEIFYAAAVNYSEYKGAEIDFTIHDVGGWVSEVGLERAGKLIEEAVSTNTPKNSHPHPAEKVGI